MTQLAEIRAGHRVPGRRSQSKRRAAARGALLDAAIACLYEDGYRGLSTRRVAERAGLSQSALMHYFPNRGEFLTAAVLQVSERLVQEVTELVVARQDLPPSERWRALLDFGWEVHNGPALTAAAELLMASRTEPELAGVAERLYTGWWELIDGFMPQIFPLEAQSPRFHGAFELAFSAHRGLAMLRTPASEEMAQEGWHNVREILVPLLVGLRDDVPAPT